MPGLPKIVLQRLRAQSAAKPGAETHAGAMPREGGAHPDANLFSAFVERTLNQEEREQVLGHLAGCSECRGTLALLAPTPAEVQGQAVAARARSALWPILRWGTLAAALGAVAIVVTLHRNDLKHDALLSRPSSPASPVVEGAAPPPPTPAPALGPEQKSHGDQARRESPDVAREIADLKDTQGTVRSGQPVAGFAPAKRKQRAEAVMTAARNAGEARATGTPENSAESQSVGTAPANPSGEVISLPPVTVFTAVSPEAAKAARIRVESHVAGLEDATARRELKSQVSSPTARWSISPDGVVQRSYDGGKTWMGVPIDRTVHFRTVASEGNEIWAGGARGGLYHSSSAGVTWVQVRVNTGPAALTETIVGVQLASPQQIAITTESGQQWMTKDGGQSWQKGP